MSEMEIIGKRSVDYFKFLCGDCGKDLEVRNLGGPVPIFKFTCSYCKKSDELKVFNFFNESDLK